MMNQTWEGWAAWEGWANTTSSLQDYRIALHVEELEEIQHNVSWKGGRKDEGTSKVRQPARLEEARVETE